MAYSESGCEHVSIQVFPVNGIWENAAHELKRGKTAGDALPQIFARYSSSGILLDRMASAMAFSITSDASTPMVLTSDRMSPSLILSNI